VALIAEIKDYFEKKQSEDDTFLPTKISSFTRQLDEISEDFAKYNEYIEHPVREFYPEDPEYSKDDRLLFMVIRDKQILKDLENRVKESFRQLFHGYEDIIGDITEIFRNRRSRKIIVATHMPPAKETYMEPAVQFQ
jgi:hypothetical protein